MNNIALQKIKKCKDRKLKELDLGNCSLSTIPLEVCELVWLEELKLTNRTESKTLRDGVFYDIEENPNIIKYIPKEILNLQNLKRLDLSGSAHNFWPISDIWFVSELPKLEYLNLKFTNVQSIEPLLPMLERGIKIKNKNRFVYVPDEKGIYLYNNSIEIPNPKLFHDDKSSTQKYNKKIVSFLRRLQHLNENEALEAKLLIIGEAGSGKTTFARKLLDPNCPLPEDNESTKGIDIHSYIFDLKNNKVGRINVWDFAGQEIYYATHKFFLTDKAIYAIVADPRKEDTNFNYWLQIVEKHGGSSPVIIILNEKDDREREIDINAIKARYKNVIGAFKVNFYTGRGFNDLLKVVKNQFETIKFNRKGLPKNWFTMRKEINKYSSFAPFIDLSEFYNSCTEFGIRSKVKKEKLLNHFHDLGVFLHYKDNPILKKTIILQKQWATESVYKIFENKKIRTQGGRFTRKDIREIWSDSQYSDMHDELLALMIKFELVYIIPDTAKESYLAPQLLPAIEPKTDLNDKNNIRIHFKYEFLPKGLLSRLIVRLSKYTTNTSKVWKTGVVLKRESSKALVHQKFGSNLIEIKVEGEDKKEFMTIISEELEILNNKYDKLDVEKLIPCNCSECVNLSPPHYYDYNGLKTRLKKNKKTIECEISYIDVNVQSLISDVFIKEFKGKKLSGEIKENVLELIKQGEIDNIWKILSPIYLNNIEFVLLMSRWKEYKRIELSNRIEFSQGQIEKERIKFSILSWLEDK